MNASLGGTKRFYQFINSRSIFLTGEEFTSLGKKFPEKRKPPLISCRSLVTNGLSIDQASRVPAGGSITYYMPTKSSTLILRFIKRFKPSV